MPPPLDCARLATVAPVPTTVTSAREPGAAREPAAASDPGAAVATFYALVANHQFDSALELWSPRMRATFPPEANLNQRFSQTQAIRLQRAEVVSQDQRQATVAVDLVESDQQAGARRFVGNWYLVRGPSGWMLDQPELRLAP